MKDLIHDNLFYVCTVIEFVARSTHNHVRDIINKLSDDDIEHQLKAASVNHCLSMEQICDEWVEDYNISNGNYNNVSACRYAVPSVPSIGRVYQRLILDVMEDNVIETLRKVYNSFMSDEISDFNSSFYYSNPDYLKCSYEEGHVLS